MVKYNVTQLRTKLGSLMQKICNDEFQAIYHTMSTKPNIANIILPNTIEDTDSFIVLLANNLDDQHAINRLVHKTKPGLIYALGARYHYLTTFFCSIDQKRIFMMRESDKDFLIDALIRIFKDDFPVWVNTRQ